MNRRFALLALPALALLAAAAPPKKAAPRPAPVPASTAPDDDWQSF